MQTLSRSKTARGCALALAMIAAITLIARLVLSSQEHGSIILGLSHLSQFFTILTNLLVVVVMIAIGLNRKLPQGILEGLVVAIVCVGVIYHLLLAHLWSPQGVAMLADQGVHTVVPILTFLWWLIFSDMCAMSWKDTLKAIVWPFIYVSYALIRAQWSDFYPYPFLNLTELGAARLVLNVIGLSFVFYMLGLILLAIARFRCRAKGLQGA